ncbi:MAG: hypothetical protein OEX00_01170, partial [Gammaproteobacteria bacterium]|nr:hypothetical protein [Gammaproteobacteria bacterium]
MGKIPEQNLPLLVLVCAPAGFGKTTWVRQFLQARNLAFAWLSLEPADSSPQRFFRYITASIRKDNTDFAEDLYRSLCSTAVLSVEYIIETLINEIAMVDSKIMLVLDDYHEIQDEVIHQGVSFLLDHAPDNFSLIITTRSDPNLPLARMRARQQLLEIRAQDLRFQDDELAQYLSSLPLPLHDLPSETLKRLNNKTEGWIAGLQLALVTVETAKDLQILLDSFDGQDRHVMDYLTDEVLSRQDESSKAFLLKTSILSRMNASLAAAVSEIATAEDILLDLERRNLFLFSLDAKRQWFRYHGLFADLLKHQLARSGPNAVRDAHLRASVWYREQHMIEASVDHAFAAQAYEVVGEIIDEHGVEMIRQMQGPLLYQWGRKLPSTKDFPFSPRRLFLLIMSAMVAGNLAESTWLQYARDILVSTEARTQDD